ncbi:inactive ubiquitin carboxyl-terminal hydrolase MINDY-4B-like [Amphibalanus amphitrite]|uniref:inactive ubiquitin carboxyl-terminal hydrolase MINDY-4B-like n=1 Tax=Amphibalanus amphitrite TaxID=1232801 RepID=UPI001C925E82|nr:inactive ubiquitin carboxyl-terminal hydrolase MINDY-4B-like [Amphibalanus amphitrite]
MYFIFQFESSEGHAYILLLYSLVLTRGINRVSDDLGEAQPSLLTSGGLVSHSLTSLVLTGQASPHLHNGIVWRQLEAGAKVALHGVPERSDVGFLLWEEAAADLLRTEVGSRLKTPLLPIWLTCCHGQYGVIFHLNRELTRDYRAEHRFDLHYYTGDEAHLERPTLIAVDTKSRPLPGPRREDGEEEEQLPPLNELILSKWPEASIDWRGTEPYL